MIEREHLARDLLRDGMSDAELEERCRPGFSGFAPWVFWSSELYSLGKCLRRFGFYPSILPLYVYCDHGPALEGDFYPHELRNAARVHLTFHPLKEQRYRNCLRKRVIRIRHPWIAYRRARAIELAADARGTLAFLPHTTPGFRWENQATGDYFTSLRALPERYQPVVLCLHMHDIHAGAHRRLRAYGFPIVTAGDTGSPVFVDRFYDLIRRFRYATSSGWGSQVAYSVELGVSYFFLGDRPTLLNLSHQEVPLGEVRHQDEQHRLYEAQADTLFGEPRDKIGADQMRFIASLLGLDSTVSRSELCFILWVEFFRHWRLWWSTWLERLWQLMNRHGVRGLLRKVRRQLREIGE